MPRSLPALLLVLVAALGSGVLLLLRSGSFGAPAAEERSTGKDAGVEAGAGDPELAARREAAADRRGPGTAAAEPEGRGVIRLVARDDRTGRPVPELPVVAFVERGGARILQWGVTDAEGRAELRGLPANAVLLESPRLPPYAPSLAAAWLTEGEQEEVELRVRRGGTLIGRVVDDLGTPLAGAEVLCWTGPGPWSLRAGVRADLEPVATTGKDGRFEVSGLSRRPRSVWIVDGWPRPEHHEEPVVWVRHGTQTQRKGGPVEEDRTLDLGDVVFPRPTRYRGVVIGPGDRPVVGALVSTHPLRGRGRRRPEGSEAGSASGPPGSEGFELLDGEALSGPGGEFEFERDGDFYPVLVWTETGERQHFPVKQGPPGEVVEGLVFRLEPETHLSVELVPASEEDTAAIAKVRSIGITAVLDEFHEVTSRAQRQPGGLFPVVLRCPPGEVQRLVLGGSGLLPAEREAHGLLSSGLQVQFVARPRPAYALALSVSVDDEATPPAEWSVHLQASVQAPRDDGTPRPGPSLGGNAWVALAEGPQEVELPVQTREALWVYPTLQARLSYEVQRSGLVDEARFKIPLPPLGPFLPTAGRHAVALSLTEVDLPEIPEPDLEPPPEGGRAPQRFATVTARVLDAQSEEPVESANLQTQEPDPQRRTWYSAQQGDEGAVFQVPAGAVSLRVWAQGYRPSQAHPTSLAPGQELHLGTLRLERLPALRGKLVCADGAAAPTGTWVNLVGPQGQLTASARAGGDGVFELRLEPQGAFQLVIHLPSPWQTDSAAGGLAGIGYAGFGNGGPVVFDARPWPEDEIREFRVPELGAVEIHLSGMPIEYHDVVPAVFAVPAGVGSAFDLDSTRSVRFQFARTRPDGIKLYRAALAVGSWSLRGGPGPFAVETREFEVTGRPRPELVTARVR